MQNSIWKLTALAGVVGIGFLIVLQMQDEMNPDPDSSDTFAETDNADSKKLVAESGEDNDEPNLWDQSEPPEMEPWESADSDSTEKINPFNNELPASLFDDPPEELITDSETLPLDDAPLRLFSSEPDDSAADFPTLNSDNEGAVRLTSSEQPALLPGISSADSPAESTETTQPLLDPPAELPGLPFPTDDPPNLDPQPFETQLPELPSGDTQLPALDSLPIEAPSISDLPALDNLDSPVDLPQIKSGGFGRTTIPDLPEAIEEPKLNEPFPSLPAEASELSPLPDNPPPLISIDLPTQPVVDEEPARQSVTSESTGTVVTDLNGDGVISADAPTSTQRPELSIEKIAPPEATLGKPMIYSIVIENVGKTNAAQVVVEDRIPKGCRLIGTIPQAELIGTKLLWRLGSMKIGEKKKVLVKVVPIEEGEVGSIATVNFVAEVAARTNVREELKPSIKLEVSTPPQAKVGETIVLSFRIANSGPQDLKDVALQEIIPTGFEHPAGEDLTYEVGAIPAGKSVDVDLEVKAIKPGTHFNRAIVTADGDVRTESQSKIEIVDARGLRIDVPHAAAKAIGETIVQPIRITNESTEPVGGTMITLVLPSALHFKQATAAGSYDKAERSITWKSPVIPAGQTLTVEAHLIAAKFGTHDYRVEMRQPGKQAKFAQASVEARGIAALRLNLENIPATATPGEEFTVDLTVQNRGTGSDSNVKVALVHSPEVEFVSSFGPVKNLPSQTTTNGRRIPFTTIPEIGERASVEFQITLRARSNGRPKVRAEIDSDQLNETLASEAAVVVLPASE